MAIEKANLRALVIGFALMDSDLPLRVAFPVLVHNALEWFQPQQEFPARRAIGSAICCGFPAGEGDLELRMPSAGKKLSLRDQYLLFTDTSKGIYIYRNLAAEKSFAINLFDEES